MSDPTEEEIAVVVIKLSAGEWKAFTERETDVAKWIVGWDDDLIPEGDGIAFGDGKDMDRENASGVE